MARWLLVYYRKGQAMTRQEKIAELERAASAASALFGRDCGSWFSPIIEKISEKATNKTGTVVYPLTERNEELTA